MKVGLEMYEIEAGNFSYLETSLIVRGQDSYLFFLLQALQSFSSRLASMKRKKYIKFYRHSAHLLTPNSLPVLRDSIIGLYIKVLVVNYGGELKFPYLNHTRISPKNIK